MDFTTTQERKPDILAAMARDALTNIATHLRNETRNLTPEDIDHTSPEELDRQGRLQLLNVDVEIVRRALACGVW